MAEDHERAGVKQHEASHDAHNAGHAVSSPLPLVSAGDTPAYPTSLVGDPGLEGRGNGPVRVALMQSMQQSYGNRAVQRFIQRVSSRSSPLPAVQRQGFGDVRIAEGKVHDEVARALVEETVRQAGAGGTMLRADDVRTMLDNRVQMADFNLAFLRIVGGLYGPDDPDLPVKAREVIRLLENHFILNPDSSSLDLLPPARRDRYRNFAWSRLDYPGHAEGEAAGPNEGRANEMAADLSGIRPERRANQGANAVLTAGESNDQMARYIESELRDVPGQPGHRLNRHALESFTQMSAAAAQDRVTLTIGSSFRSAAASRNASAGQNRAAIAQFSTHNMGLAIDLNMSHGTQRFQETTTRPMQNVVDMRKSPVHKWMFLRGASHGWFPYQNEPWHWEYNPAGFRERFRENLAQAQPAPAR